MFKHNSVGRLGFFLGILVLTNGCAVGEIGGSAGGPRLDVGFDDAALSCPGANADVSASSGWESKPASQSAPDRLYFGVMARPTKANLDALVAVGAEDLHDLSDAAIAVRFSETGLVDVMDDSEYSSDGDFQYDPGVWYNIAISADVVAETYDVEVGRCGEKRRTVIRGAKFRAAAHVYDRLSNWGVWSSQRAALELSTPTWMASGTCAPATCESLDAQCGAPSDGCNGTLNCGGCGGGQMCLSGTCVDEPVSASPPPSCTPATCASLGAECGALNDGCSGVLNCGGCSVGQSCSNSVCVDPPPPVTLAPPPACVPDTCAFLGAECGARIDGCGGVLNCGGCSVGRTCSNSVCVDPPVTPPPPPACVPDTCASVGAECGARVDGCGSTLNCGGCGAGRMCSNSVCINEPPPPPPACVPDTCAFLGAECGTRIDGCGGTLNCGGCGSGETCSSNVCIDQPVTPPPPPPGGQPNRPWAHNTGPTDVTALVPSGSITLSSPGVYTNLDVTGDIYITSDNVTVRNFRVNANGGQRAVDIAPGRRGIVLEDGELHGMSSIGIYGMGYTARRLYIHDSGGDALRPEGRSGSGPTLVEYCFIEKMGLSPSAHADALQVSNVSEGSYDVTLQFNNLYMPAPGTPGHPGDTSKASAVVFLEKPVSNYLVQNNWLDGGGYTLYCGNNTGGVVWRDNIFGNNYDFGPVIGTCQNWSGNVWEDTGNPVSPN